MSTWFERLRLEARPAPSRTMQWVSPLIAAVLTVVAGFAMFLALGKDPLVAFHAFFVAPLSSVNGWSELVLKASPLMLIATGLAAGYRANVWNIGAEGQLTMGAVAGGGVALALHGVESALVLPAMLAAGVLGGMAWAAIPAWLRTRFHANEILTSLMLVYVATLVLSLLVHDAWRDPEGFNFPQSKLFSDSAILPNLAEGTRLNVGLFVALAASVALMATTARAQETTGTIEGAVTDRTASALVGARVVAINLDTGDFVWQVPHGETPDVVRNHPALKGLNIPRTGRNGAVGTLVTKTLVIAGEPGYGPTPSGARGSLLRAYDKRTGADAGAVYMPAPQSGSPMTYMLNGKQYLVVAISGGNYSGELVAFTLPN